MKKTFMTLTLLGAITSTNINAETYDFDRFSLSTLKYKLQDDIDGSGHELDVRGLNDNIVWQASYSTGDIEDVDINQINVSLGYAIQNTEKSLTAVGFSVGRAEASVGGFSVDNDYKALNLIHSYRGSDFAELNLRLSAVRPDESDNYNEFEIVISHFLFDNFALDAGMILNDESENIFLLGASSRF